MTFNPAGAFAQSADLKTRVDGLSVDIRAAPAPNADLKKSLIELRSAIDALELKSPADMTADLPAFLNRAEEILPITRRIAAAPTNVTPVIAAKASELIAAARGIESVDPTNVAIARATALSEALKPPNNIIKTYPALTDAVTTLLPALENLEEVDFLKAVRRRSTSLTTLLTGAGSAPPTSLEVMTEVTSLEAAILAYRKHGDPAVDIVFAEYGDLRDRNSHRQGRQLCEATASMRKQCQGHPTCQLPASPETALCHDDPAPYIPNIHKGVWILFRCVDSLLNVYAPPALPSMVPSYGNANWVPLRSSTDEVSCVPPRLSDVVQK